MIIEMERLPENITFLLHYENQHDTLKFMVPSWSNQTMPGSMYFYMVGLYITIVGILGVLGNLFVLIIFFTVKSLRTPRNTLVMNLALSDMSFCAINGFPIKTIAAFKQKWIWGKIMCDFYGFTSGVFGFASLTTMVMISLERYCAIVWYDERSLQMDRRKTLWAISVVWIWSLIWPSPPLFGIGRYVLEGFHTSCSFDYASRDWPNILFNAGLYIFGFSLPVLIIALSYFEIVRFVRRNEREMVRFYDAACPGRRRGSKRTPGYRKVDLEAAKSAVIIVALFLMAWTPYALVCVTPLLGYRKQLSPYLTELPGLFAKNAAVYNPFVYIIRTPNFRRKLGQRFNFFQWCLPKKKMGAGVTIVSKISLEPLDSQMHSMHRSLTHRSMSHSGSSESFSPLRDIPDRPIRITQMETLTRST